MAGQVVRDRTAGGYVAGGAAVYSAMLAFKLGYEPLVVSRHAELAEELPFKVCNQGDARTTTFENTYDNDGVRHQRVAEAAAELEPAGLRGLQAPVAFAGTVLGEVPPGVLEAVAAPLKGIGLQGYFRALDESGTVHQQLPPDNLLKDLAREAGVVFLSYEDLPKGEEQSCLTFLRQHARNLVITDAARGADFSLEDGSGHIDSFPADPVDPTGAGDVFAMAFLLRLHETGSAEASVRFASAAASVNVEGRGLAGVPDRAAIDSRLAAHPEVRVQWQR